MRAVERIGAPVNLVGDCQGGWLAAIYAALHPGRVHTLTVAGAPIDFHAGLGAPIPAYVDGFTAGGATWASTGRSSRPAAASCPARASSWASSR